MMQNIGQEDRNPAAAENPASLSLPQDPPRADSWVLDLERVFVWAREVATVWDGDADQGPDEAERAVLAAYEEEDFVPGEPLTPQSDDFRRQEAESKAESQESSAIPQFRSSVDRVATGSLLLWDRLGASQRPPYPPFLPVNRPAQGTGTSPIAMASGSLQVRFPDMSTTKQKAIEDAKKMQAIVEEDCGKAGKDVPPYQLQELIGKGNYGRVYKATDVNTKALVAVKIINIEEGDTLNPKLADTYSEFMHEFSALKMLGESGAKNINLTLDALPVGQAMWMVTEYCAGGSVATLMKPTAPGGLQEKWIIPIVREVAEAIYWVHKEGIIHRDIKCANVLVTEAGSVQLCDFGVAGIVESKLDKRTTFIGTLNWMAPELFDPEPAYSTPVDIWAFGSLVYELASGFPPNVMAGFNVQQLGQYIKHHAPRLEGDYSEQIKDLVAFCLVEDPAKRPTIQEIQQHPFIHGTSALYPAASLANLVKAYKLWEGQGGIRRSLFTPVGVQGPSDYASIPPSDEWNFSTTVDFDRQVMNTDARAVFDVYGSNVDFEYDEQTSRPAKPKPRRRPPPPQLQPHKAPLEKVFDPNTISNYEDNSRAYYGRAPPPPMTSTTNTTSDLPLRDDSLHSTLRESLIDLDASLHDGGDLSQFVDMATIRAGMRVPSDDDDDETTDYNRPPLSDPADLNPNRRTQEWKFPTMVAPPASANPEMSRFPFHEERADPTTSRPPMIYHPTDPSGYLSSSEPYDLGPPPPHQHHQLHQQQPQHHQMQMQMQMPDNRASVGSLIDLDEGLVMPELTRPSTANSDVVSVTGSDIGGANPFDLERHASLYQPIGTTTQLGGIREPSIFISDDSDFARLAKSTDDDGQGSIPPDFIPPGMGGMGMNRSGSQSVSHSRSTSYDDDSYSVSGYESEYLPAGGSASGSGRMGGGSAVVGSAPRDITDRRSRARTRARSQSNASLNSIGGSAPVPGLLQQREHQHQQQQYQNGQYHQNLHQQPPRIVTGMNINNPGMGMGINMSIDPNGTALNNAPPLPPSASVMQGTAEREEVRDEVMRLLAGFAEQLSMTNEFVSALPVRRGRGGGERE